MDVLGPRDSRDDHTSLLHLYDPERRRSSALSPRRTSGASSVSGLSLPYVLLLLLYVATTHHPHAYY
jgi:hypothetical protein